MQLNRLRRRVEQIFRKHQIQPLYEHVKIKHCDQEENAVKKLQKSFDLKAGSDFRIDYGLVQKSAKYQDKKMNS